MIIKAQMCIYRDLLHYGMKKVPLGRNDETVLPNGTVKKKAWTGNKLLEFLCDRLKQLIQAIIDEFSVFKLWREIAKLENAQDSSTQFAAECEESESDGESVAEPN